MTQIMTVSVIGSLISDLTGSGPGGLPGMPGGFGSLLGGGGGGMPDLGSILNNPNMMNMAAQMMQNPAMQQM